MGNRGGLLVFVLVLCSIIIYLSFLNVENYITGYQASTGNPAYNPGYTPPARQTIGTANPKSPVITERTFALSDGRGGIYIGRGATIDEAKADAKKRMADGDKPDKTYSTIPNKYIPSPVERARNDGYTLGQLAKENALKQELKKLQNEAQHRTNQVALTGDVNNKLRDTEIANRINEINDILNRLKK